MIARDIRLILMIREGSCQVRALHVVPLALNQSYGRH